MYNLTSILLHVALKNKFLPVNKAAPFIILYFLIIVFTKLLHVIFKYLRVNIGPQKRLEFATWKFIRIIRFTVGE